MIDFESETVLTLAEAAKMLPNLRGKKPPHPATLYRWATTGVRAKSGRRVYLETEFVGGTRVTSKEALDRLRLRINDVEYVPVAPSKEREQRSLARQAAEAMEVLRREGMV